MPSLHAALEALSDAELLEGTRRLVGRSNLLLAELLAHLAEVEARGIHRTRACSSLYTYCIYELRFSEDEAFRRVAAARLVKRFPALLDAVATGELHLTGLLMLGPHLTETNLVEVLARARHRTKREIAQLVRVLDPLPAVPSRIEPLGPAPARGIPSAATWQTFTDALCPVRELTPGDRPRDWANGANDGAAPAPDVSVPSASDLAESSPELEPRRYGVHFTATEEYVRLVDEAQALLAHTAPGATLAEIQLRALRAFVAGLRKQKYATAKVAPDAAANDSARSDSAPTDTGPAHPDTEPAPRQNPEGKPEPEVPRQRGRHIPAAVRRAVFARDAGCCSYVDSGGRRCSETHRLEFHHLEPLAAGGEHALSNLALRCRAHNALAAERDFGRAFVEEKRDSARHEPFGRQSTTG